MPFSGSFPSSSPNMDYQNPTVARTMIKDMEAYILHIRQITGIPVSTSNEDLNIAQKLYDDDSSKDFKILVDDEEYRVHKCILKVSSPKLATLIGAEDHSGVLQIVEFSPKTIEKFIRFLYKNEISEESAKNPKVLTGLIKFGHMYKIEQLVNYSIKLVGINKDQFDKNVRRNFIIMAIHQSEKILDAVLGVFKTESFTTDDDESPKKQYQPAPPFSFGRQ